MTDHDRSVPDAVNGAAAGARSALAGQSAQQPGAALRRRSHPVVALEAGIVVASRSLAGDGSPVLCLALSRLARRGAIVIAVAGERPRRALARLTAIALDLVSVVRQAVVAPAPAPVAVVRRALVAGALALWDAVGPRFLAVLVQFGAGLVEPGLGAGALCLLAGDARGVLGAGGLGVGDLRAGLAAAALLALVLSELLAAARLTTLGRLAPAGGHRYDQQDQDQYCRDGDGDDGCGAHGIPPGDRVVS
jgi:hypothetical protein